MIHGLCDYPKARVVAPREMTLFGEEEEDGERGHLPGPGAGPIPGRSIAVAEHDIS